MGICDPILSLATVFWCFPLRISFAYASWMLSDRYKSPLLIVVLLNRNVRVTWLFLIRNFTISYRLRLIIHRSLFISLPIYHLLKMTLRMHLAGQYLHVHNCVRFLFSLNRRLHLTSTSPRSTAIFSLTKRFHLDDSIQPMGWLHDDSLCFYGINMAHASSLAYRLQ
jgi:hypothetical protein